MSHNTREDALAGGAAGGAFGHHQGEGHTGRDAVVGAVGADELGKHENKNQAQGKVPITQKVEGKAEELMGKMTGNSGKVSEGQSRRTGAGSGPGM